MASREQKSQEHIKDSLTFGPFTRTLVPPAQQYGTRVPTWPWLYSAVLGNGHLLVCLDEAGSISQLFYPYIDAGPHLRSFLIGIQVADITQAENSTLSQQVDGAGASAEQVTISWLADEGWAHELRYAGGTAAAVVCISSNPTVGLQIEQSMFVHPDVNAFISEVKVNNLRSLPIDCRLLTYAGFDFDNRRSGNTCLFDVHTSALTFFSFDRYVAITCNAPVAGFATDRTSLDKLDVVFEDVNAGKFSGRDYAIGQVSGAVSYDFGEIRAGDSTLRSLSLSFGRSLEEVKALTASVAARLPGFEEAISWWRTKYAPTQLGAGSSIVRDVYDRSLMVLRLLTDSTTGGVIAAPEVDPDFTSCGGYGLCWPRDGAFIGHALDVVGEYEHARTFYDWALRIQSTAGGWYQRYYVSGQLASTWGLVQFDEVGIVIWSICRHIQLTGDINYGHKVFPQLIRACEYMQSELDAETGLAAMTKDLWEERDGISTYACASTWGGFHELSELALRLGETSAAERWASVANKLKAAIEIHLWDTERGRFLRGMKTQIYSHDIEYMRTQPGFTETSILQTESAGGPRYFLRHDAVIDSSILGLSIPFGVFSPDDPRILATAEAIAAHLTSPIGGIFRYQGDPYRGGNPWVICTLWLAWQDLLAGKKERALDLYNWVLEHRTALDLLPEQVDRITAEPCWVVPLGWSHAMFLLLSHAIAKQNML